MNQPAPAAPDPHHVGKKELAWTFFKIGLTSYGGPAIVAQIREQIVLRRRWLTQEEFEESLAFCQVLPGPIAVQTAAHIGWRLHGGLGEFLALFFYVLPASALMTSLSAAYFALGNLPWVASLFKGLGAVVVAVVADAIMSMARTSLKDWRGVAVATLAGFGFFGGLDALLVLMGAALTGAFFLRNSASTSPSASGGQRLKAPRTSYLKTVAAAAAIYLSLAVLLFLSKFISPALPKVGAAMVKVNLLAFGGGYTAVALMNQLVVSSNGWLSQKEFVDGLALGQITPGPVITTATFIGYHQFGITGALLSTLCVFLPSAVLMALLAPQFNRIRDLATVGAMVRGLMAAFIAMLLHVLWGVSATSFDGPATAVMAALAFAAFRFKISPVWVVLAAAALSLFLFR